MRSMIYPVGIQSFEEIRKGDYCYVDKTAQIYQLVKTGKYYFLSRPRRFGKSLLISTLEAYFQGKKELFHGLAMEALEKEWTTYPVLHLDLNAQKYDTPEALIHVLEENLQYWESLYGASESEIGVARRFNGVIRRAAEKTGKSVVVLVDEYDKRFHTYTLGFPNREVEEGFIKFLLPLYSATSKADSAFEIVR